MKNQEKVDPIETITFLTVPCVATIFLICGIIKMAGVNSVGHYLKIIAGIFAGINLVMAIMRLRGNNMKGDFIFILNAICFAISIAIVAF
jgi:membrane-bound ClpP family serine protease